MVGEQFWFPLSVYFTLVSVLNFCASYSASLLALKKQNEIKEMQFRKAIRTAQYCTEKLRRNFSKSTSKLSNLVPLHKNITSHVLWSHPKWNFESVIDFIIQWNFLMQSNLSLDMCLVKNKNTYVIHAHTRNINPYIVFPQSVKKTRHQIAG